MSTSLANCRILLSKEMGDYWASTTTSAGDTGKKTLVDSALTEKTEDWITDGCTALITEANDSSEDDERKVNSLDPNTGTASCRAFTAQITSGVDYEFHRLFSASEKRRALVHAAKASFPHLFIEIRDESLVSHNWLKDGSFEIWTTTTDPTYWSNSVVTSTKTTSSPYYKHGATSCKLSGTAGYIYQSISEWDDLKYLAGHAVTFTAQAYSTVGSSVRLAIYDGTTTTYSSYQSDASAWTEDNDPLSVQATIQAHPTAIQFRIYYASGTAYVDDARVIGPYVPRTYIGNLGLVQNKPHQVLVEPSDYSTQAKWILVHNIKYDQTNGYMYLPAGVSKDHRLRILGLKYLDFYDSSDVVGTDWEDEIDIDTPQLEILIVEAAIYLCKQKILPTEDQGTNEQWREALAYWDMELRARQGAFSMPAPAATVNWR